MSETSAAIDPTVSERDIDKLLAELLDDDDTSYAAWHDPEAIAMHVQILATAAALAGMSMLEALVHVVGGGALPPSVNDAGDALLALHRGLIAYQRHTLRRDGLERAWSALEHAVGAGIAACTMGALERLRAGLVGLMGEHEIRCDGPPRRD